MNTTARLETNERRDREVTNIIKQVLTSLETWLRTSEAFYKRLFDWKPYNLAFKLKIVAETEAVKNNSEIAREYSISESGVRCQTALREMSRQNTDLYSTFVDLTKAFDSVSRDGLWRVMRKYGWPDKFTTVVRQFHDGMLAHVQDNAETSEALPVTE